MNMLDLKQFVVATDEERDSYTLRVKDNLDIVVARERIDQPDGSIIIDEDADGRSIVKMFS
ncbi:hypothetical protein ECB98_15060 [Brucellaceae bacterium VT-16-1752]|nr:hypothetical protein ECB98_15060 [Brucellaceae bacterium VT-16-1752]